MKIRKRRQELGLTLDELAGRTRVSKPYLSLIETGRVNNPPSDEKLRQIEHALGFAPAELVSQAHLQRTPRDVRAMLMKLLREKNGQGLADVGSDQPRQAGANGEVSSGGDTAGGSGAADDQRAEVLDAAFSAGVLAELAERRSGNVEPVRANAVPVINKVSAGYPQEFTDLGYPRGHADAFVSCPDLDDADAFAARVQGDSMQPVYEEGDIVIFSPAQPPRHGDDCFVRFDDGQTTFKRVFFEQDDTGVGVIRLQPRNEKYPPRTVPAQEVVGLYRGVFRYQRVNER